MVVERKRGRAGQEQRARRMERTNWLCEHCLDEGVTRAAVIVDHVVPLAKGGSDDDANTRNLCKPHADRATAVQFGHKMPIKGKGTGRDGRPTSPDHPWNRAG